MVALVRTGSGLLYQSDGTLTGWTANADWSSVSTNRFVAAPIGPIQAGTFSSPMKGESNLHSYNGYWYLSFDDKVTGGKSIPGLQRSADRGITWQDLGNFTFSSSLSGISGLGADLYLDPGGNWISQATVGTGGIGRTGGINPPYTFQIFQSTSGIQGPYANINTLANYAGTWADTGLSAGGAIFDGVNYNLFAGGINTISVQVSGLIQGTSWSGSFTQPNPSTPVYDITVSGPLLTSVSMYAAEGPYVALNPVLNLYVMIVIGLANAGGSIGGYCFSSIIQTSASLSFPTSGWKHIQWPCPADNPTVIQQSAIAYSGPNNVPMVGPNGEMLVITTGQDPAKGDDGLSGHYANHVAYYATLEPATAVIRYAGSADTTLRRIWRSITHTNLTVELCAEQLALNGGGGFIQVSYRGDSTGNNEYRATLTVSSHWSLVKVTGGSSATIAAGSGSQIWDNKGAPSGGLLHRLKVQVVGNLHTAYLDGEQQYSFTDSSSPYTSGTACSVWGQGLDCDLINLSYRMSDTITVNGMTPNTSVWLRGFCGYPIASIVANGSGIGTVSYQHFPLYSIDFAGTDYTVGSDLRIWGGDTLQFSGMPVAAAPAIPSRFLYM